ncbi:MAG: hypothetical protein JO093_17955 [Acidobacteria bacterium]|nr:hypothetical protein [Acidobacteriota bacterium]MBV9069062.1 hypothetical protein [Acidobacteriota bacterium]MBV9187506.1 hypothetical protein [Acidobacteriota bacterium]
MRIAAGFKAHSGWAALVVIGSSDGGFVVVDRRRIELVDEVWAKQPYHAAEQLPEVEARRLVQRGVASAHRIAEREMRVFVKRSARHEIAGCAVIVGSPMPDWTFEQIRSVHVRMHKAEGVLFPAALIAAAEACDLNVVAVPEKGLTLDDRVVTLGKSAGPPWGKDQKTAATAALITLANVA